MMTDCYPTTEITKFDPKRTTDVDSTTQVPKSNPKMTNDVHPTSEVTKSNPKMTNDVHPTTEVTKSNPKMTNGVHPTTEVTKSSPQDVDEPLDEYAEKMKLCDIVKKISDFSEDSLNLDSKLRQDPEYKSKYMALLAQFQEQGGKIYNLSPEEIESQKQKMQEKINESFAQKDKPLPNDFHRLLVTKNATFNARNHLEKLKLTEGNYDCTNVKLSRTEIVSPEHHFYGKKVKRKFQGQRQVAVEVKSHGIVAKKCAYEYLLDTKKPFIVLNGVAGSGKSVILRELAFEFYQVKDFNVDGLSNYELLVRYECRNVQVMNYEQLIEFNFPSVCGHLGVDAVANVIAKLKVLYVVDGWDEANSVSELVLKDILKRSFTNDEDNKSSIIFGARPHAVQILKDFLKSFKIPANDIDVINVPY